jgi:glutamate/tyrosine decarboxylase-like PLP-dependent enzyme
VGSRFDLTAGVDQADSWATDGHKWPQAPYDCGLAIVRDELAMRRAMTIAASYLPEAAANERDPTHYVPELSRRARGFATWAVIRALGRSGIAELVERNCRVATLMADRLAAEPGVAVVNDVVLNQVLVRFGVDEAPERGDELTRMTIRRIQQDATCMAGGTDWRGRHVMRLSVIGGTTHEVDGARSAEAIVSAWRTVRSSTNGPLPG